MKVVSVNVGTVGDLFVRQSNEVRRVVSGIRKQAVHGTVEVKKLGLVGDEQADLSVHGGLDKAVYAYPGEHYPFWDAQRLAVLRRDEPLAPGAMGENLTLEGVLEGDLWVGDLLQVGASGLLLQVTEPRQPCFKFNVHMGFSHAAKAMTQSGYTGIYLRVVETGFIMAGDLVTLTPGPREISVSRINERRRMGRQRDLF